MKTACILTLSLLLMSALPALSQVDKDLEQKKSLAAMIEENFTKLSPEEKKKTLQYQRYQFFNACGEIALEVRWPLSEPRPIYPVIEDSVQSKLLRNGISLGRSAAYDLRMTLSSGDSGYWTNLEFRRPLHDFLTGLTYTQTVWEYDIQGSVPGNQILHAHHLVDAFLQYYWRANAKCRTPFSVD